MLTDDDNLGLSIFLALVVMLRMFGFIWKMVVDDYDPFEAIDRWKRARARRKRVRRREMRGCMAHILHKETWGSIVARRYEPVYGSPRVLEQWLVEWDDPDRRITWEIAEKFQSIDAIPTWVD